MKTLFAIAAAVAAVGSSLPASSQSQPNIAVAPTERSTGPTVPDARTVEFHTAVPRSRDGGSNAIDGRAAGGFDNDPNNPTGAPGPTPGVNTSPIR